MSALKRMGSAAAIVVIALAVGCKFDDANSIGTEGKYDVRSLDVYMGDADRHAPKIQTVSDVQTGDAQAQQPTQQGGDAQATQDEGFYGHWVASLDVKAEIAREKSKMAADPNMTEEQKKAAEQFTEAMAQALGSMMTFDLTINKDKTFSMAMMGMPMKGTWVQNGDTLSLTPTEFMGMKPEDFAKQQGAQAKVNDQPMLLKVAKDGQSLLAIDSRHTPESQDLVFKRPAAG